MTTAEKNMIVQGLQEVRNKVTLQKKLEREFA
jgi:hypothetical protein